MDDNIDQRSIIIEDDLQNTTQIFEGLEREGNIDLYDHEIFNDSCSRVSSGGDIGFIIFWKQ